MSRCSMCGTKECCGAELEPQLDSLLEQWARLNKVADKFTLARLEDAGEEWQEFCVTMNALVCSRKIIA